MSTTLKLDPKRLIVYYSPTVLSIVAGGQHRRFFAEETGEDTLKEIYNLAKRFKESGKDKDGQELVKYLDPDYRMKISEDLCQDMQGNYYLTQLPHVPIAPAVSRMLRKYQDKGLDITPVVNLWKLALDNPNEQARLGLMDYIDRFGVPVTDSGYMILYKSVRDKNDVIEKLAFVVGEEYFDKMKHRKNPADYWVFEHPQDAAYRDEVPRFFVRDHQDVTCEVLVAPDSEAAKARYEVWWSESDHEEGATPDATAETYEQAMAALLELGGSRYDSDAIVDRGNYREAKLEPVGNLKDLFKELVLEKEDIEATEEESQPVWEPYHRGDYGMEIKLGEVVTMPRNECDPDITRECSYGLHVGSYEYVRKFHSNDGHILACLVNPRDIVALPEYDNSKIRTCAYMPYGVIKQAEDGSWSEAETSYWEEDFIDYERSQLEQRIESLREQLDRAPENDPAWQIEEMLELAEKRLVDISS